MKQKCFRIRVLASRGQWTNEEHSLTFSWQALLRLHAIRLILRYFTMNLESLVSQNFIGDMVESGMSHKEISSHLKALFPAGQRGISSRSVERYCTSHNLHYRNKNISTQELNSIVDEAVKEASEYFIVIDLFYLLCTEDIIGLILDILITLKGWPYVWPKVYDRSSTSYQRPKDWSESCWFFT